MINSSTRPILPIALILSLPAAGCYPFSRIPLSRADVCGEDERAGAMIEEVTPFDIAEREDIADYMQRRMNTFCQDSGVQKLGASAGLRLGRDGFYATLVPKMKSDAVFRTPCKSNSWSVAVDRCVHNLEEELERRFPSRAPVISLSPPAISQMTRQVEPPPPPEELPLAEQLSDPPPPPPPPPPPDPEPEPRLPQLISAGDFAQNAPWHAWAAELIGRSALKKEWEYRGCKPFSEEPSAPVTCITPYRARDYCEFAGGRLPLCEELAVSDGREPELREWCTKDGSGDPAALASMIAGKTASIQFGRHAAASIAFRCVIEE